MNKLSWLIYFANISQTTANWFTIFAVISGFALAIAIICAIFVFDRHTVDLGQKKTALKVIWFAAPIFFVSFWAATLLPSQQTVMLIAASQYGEMVAENPKIQQSVVNPALQLLQNWMTQETKALLSPPSNN